jgi:hypothetical protein
MIGTVGFVALVGLIMMIASTPAPTVTFYNNGITGNVVAEGGYTPINWGALSRILFVILLTVGATYLYFEKHE